MGCMVQFVLMEAPGPIWRQLWFVRILGSQNMVSDFIIAIDMYIVFRLRWLYFNLFKSGLSFVQCADGDAGLHINY